MTTKTALNLLGPLASRKVQRRYIVQATGESYILPTEALNNGYYFLRHPSLGAFRTLPSVQAFARVLEECAPKVPLEDPAIANEMLVEQDASWARIRSAAKEVLQEIGADLEGWEREELGVVHPAGRLTRLEEHAEAVLAAESLAERLSRYPRLPTGKPGKKGWRSNIIEIAIVVIIIGLVVRACG